MHFRSILGGTLAVMLLSVPAVHARDAASTSPRDNPQSASSPRFGAQGVPVPHIGLPGVFESGDQQPIRLAQVQSDPRVVALEEQIRALNGTMEELNFQILQLQEQIRKMQEDNEFRFQELEKRSDARGPKENGAVAEKPVDGGTADRPVKQADGAAPASVEDIIVSDQTTENAGAAGPGEPEKNFGVLKVDEGGNVVSDGATDKPAAADDTVVAALPSSDDPEELYRNAYQFILSGDYGTAETGFRDHIARFPEDGRAADASFWLGEALLGQKKYRDAAEVFLAANKAYPKSKKAADMLLKLGISLVGLKQLDVACATFGEVGKRYPEASVALKDRVKQERALASC